MTDIVQRIQELQFTDRSSAEKLLTEFIRDTLPLDVVATELRPLAVSLNSFNGFMTLADGTRLFFKTHTESNTVIGEYYNAQSLAEAGYDVLKPRYSSTEVGRQLLVYDVVTDPTVFDLAWAVETGDADALDSLRAAQQRADVALAGIYRATLAWQEAAEAARASVHQLFHHRVVGGRLAGFYGPGQSIALPGATLPMSEVRSWRWTINGSRYDASLDDLIATAATLLEPAQPGPSVVGHGDAHNGNVFCRTADNTLFYFDPAFAGRHNPLLDVVKPLFHNAFAMWMYYPQVKGQATTITMTRTDGRVEIEHDYEIPAVRRMFLDSKIDHVVIPLVRDLAARSWLRPDWRSFLKAALSCCPLLTMNLADAAKFPPSISLLGLAMTVEMGADSAGRRSLIDQSLDRVEAAL